MATKKEKRARAKAKHEEFMEHVRLTGLEAQRQDRADRERMDKMREENAAADKRKNDTAKAIKKIKPTS